MISSYSFLGRIDGFRIGLVDMVEVFAFVGSGFEEVCLDLEDYRSEVRGFCEVFFG